MDKNLKKVCVVTAARSEYGPLRWVIDELLNSDDLQLQLIATGSHMSEEFGMTYRFIEDDGYVIDEKIDMGLTTGDRSSIPRSMGICAEKIGDAFCRLKPDIIVVLGDRYELLPICSTALVLNIPIAHISGGDVTEGAIDNEVRNAVSMMSTLHFPGLKESANRLYRMLGSEKNVYAVGEPGLDSFLRYDLMSRKELAESLNIDPGKDWALVTLHSETKESLQYNVRMAHNLYYVMKEYSNVEFVVTKANADFGGTQINDFWNSLNDSYIKVIPSLGQKRYLSFMKQVIAVIGNSSSGVIEAPFLGVPVVNIGNRQKGRPVCKNVINCDSNIEDIEMAFRQVGSHRIIDNYWGDGHSSERIVSYIKDYLYNLK
jgi:UDP-hydrolysing UDP-N-acetyl-D-glucosamine 2-epimerase